MRFTYKAYENLVYSIKDNGYNITNYKEWKNFSKCVIFRHDIDYDILKAVRLAMLEKELGVKSTFFVLLSSDFYNPFSKQTYDGLLRIMNSGHEIGLHFDETSYNCEGDLLKVIECILKEREILQSLLGKIDVVSMHRPSKFVLESSLQIPGMINSYDKIFFQKFKYLSDSRRVWKEPVDMIIEQGDYQRLHILTHAFWYNDYEVDLSDSVRNFVSKGNEMRYLWMSKNIYDMDSIMNKREIEVRK